MGLWRGFFTFGSRSSSTVPPAASIFSRAVAEMRWTRTVSFSVTSPSPSSLMSVFVFLISPFSTSVSGVTSSPAAKRVRSRTLTGTVEVRNGPTGIASFDVEPRSLPIRM